MPYSTDELLLTLKTARKGRGLSQRDLSGQTGVPQSHISKIESGGTDLRLSSFVELVRALDYEVVLVPRKFLPAVEAIVRNTSSVVAEDARVRLSIINRAQSAVTQLDRLHPDAPGLESLTQTLRELTNVHLASSDLEVIRRITGRLVKLPASSNALPVILNASKQLRDLRNRIAHAEPKTPRPAYSLDDEDDDA